MSGISRWQNTIMPKNERQRIERQKMSRGRERDEVAPIKQLSVSVDQATTEIIKALQKAQGAERIHTVRDIVNAVLQEEVKAKDVLAFYEDVWLRVVRRPEQRLLARYSWSEDLDKALRQLAMEVLGAPNRSEMFRILVAFAGVKSGIVRVEWTKAATLSISSARHPSELWSHKRPVV